MPDKRWPPQRARVEWWVCAFPRSLPPGRVTVGGQQLLHGKLLEDTELRHGVRSPMHSSLSSPISAGEHRTQVPHRGIVHGACRRRGDPSKVLKALAADIEVIVADALTNDHIELIARAVADLKFFEISCLLCISFCFVILYVTI